MLGPFGADCDKGAAIVGIEAGDPLIGAEESMLLFLAQVEDGSTELAAADGFARDG